MERTDSKLSNYNRLVAAQGLVCVGSVKQIIKRDIHELVDLGRSGGVGKDRNPLRAWKRGVKWVRDVGMGWERAGVCALGVEQGGQ